MLLPLVYDKDKSERAVLFTSNLEGCMCNTKTVRLLLAGFYGMLAGNIKHEASKDGMGNLFSLNGGLEIPNHPHLGPAHTSRGEWLPVDSLDVDGKVPDSILPFDVAIIASDPAVVSVAIASAVADLGKPVVVMSTGHNKQQEGDLAEIGRKIPIVLWDLPVDESDEGRRKAACYALASATWLANHQSAPGVYPMSEHIIGIK